MFIIIIVMGLASPVWLMINHLIKNTCIVTSVMSMPQ